MGVASHCVSLTYTWLHPEIFSHGIPHAVQPSHLTLPNDGDELTRAVLPAFLLDQTRQFQRAVTRMLRPIRTDLLLTILAPDTFTTCAWAFEVSCLFFEKETGLGASGWRCELGRDD
jgi:hypothetical protein